jgi:hypothetical protein
MKRAVTVMNEGRGMMNDDESPLLRTKRTRVQGFKGAPFRPAVAIDADNAGSLSTSLDRPTRWGLDLGSAWLEGHDKNEIQVLDSGTLP